MKTTKSMPTKEELQEIRRSKNADLLTRMKAGDTLAQVDVMDSWFPPRPVIRKDRKLVDQLYRTKEVEMKETKETKKEKETIE